jgi:hypothetical protein
VERRRRRRAARDGTRPVGPREAAAAGDDGEAR